MIAKTQTLRAVGYCRTSSEAQRDNASIPIQKKAIENFIQTNRWKFEKHFVDESKSGATIEGRNEFKRMLAEAYQSKFDIIVCYDVTRYGRDGVDILSTSKSLGQVGVHVCDVSGKFDSRNPENILPNYVFAGAAESEKYNILKRTRTARIKLAQDKHQSANGKKPWGRTWDKKSETWQIEPDKQKIIQDIAKRYLKLDSISKLSDEYGLKVCQTYKILRETAGDTWIQNPRDVQGNVIRIETKIPPLLDKLTLDKVHRLMAKNRTFTVRDNSYLLTGYIRCHECGYALCGQKNRHGRRYYRHRRKDVTRPCSLEPKPHVPAELIEEKVLKTLLDLFSNRGAISRALAAAYPNQKQRNELRKELENYNKRLAEATKRIDALYAKLGDSNSKLSPAKLEEQIIKLEAEQKKFKSEVSKLQRRLKVIDPDKEYDRQLKNLSITEIVTKYGYDYSKLTHDDAVRLLEGSFYPNYDNYLEESWNEDSLPERNPGIYVYPDPDETKSRGKTFKFKMFGLMAVNRDGQEIVCSNMPGVSDAHHGECFCE